MYYFWLLWVFVAASGLSLVAASRGDCSLQSMGSRHTGFSNCDARTQLLHGMLDLPEPGIKPMSPCIVRQIPIHCTTKEVPKLSF